MRRLLLLRHAKAVAFTGLDDHGRGLTDRGRADAARIGAFIAARKLAPGLMVASDARRTEETASIVLKSLPAGVSVTTQARLYDAPRATILRLLRDLPDEFASILVVGHNPGMAETANALAAAGKRALLDAMSAKFPTAGLAVLEFPCARWRELTAGSGRLAAFVTPAGLPASDA